MLVFAFAVHSPLLCIGLCYAFTFVARLLLLCKITAFFVCLQIILYFAICFVQIHLVRRDNSIGSVGGVALFGKPCLYVVYAEACFEFLTAVP